MSRYRDIGVGKSGFIERHGLWTEEQKTAAEELIAEVDSRGLDIVRLAYPDQHGLVRGKWLTRDAFMSAMRNGFDFGVAHTCWDTGQTIVYNPFIVGGGFGRSDMSGFPDGLLVPDPLTFRIVPWAHRAGWILTDLYYSNGNPVPFAPRHVLRRVLDDLGARGFRCVTGLEVEWYLTKLEDPMLEPEHLGGPGNPPAAPRVRPVGHGYQYQTDSHLDEVEPIVNTVRENLISAGLPVRSIEDEWGPGQLEFTFHPMEAMAAADAMVFFRMATKQICRRLGYLATFMCQPAIPRFYGSGWHLHQSLYDIGRDQNAFSSSNQHLPLSETGLHYAGGILEHASAACVFTTPTINGYRRVKPYSLAPDRATWADDNRAAMLRAQGGFEDPTAHIENRVGDPAATPYLYAASQVVSGLDGLDNRRDPGAPSDAPYEETARQHLPTSLKAAVGALKEDDLFAKHFGQEFIDFIITLKESEIGRFEAYLEAEGISTEEADQTVTSWEQNEYLELF